MHNSGLHSNVQYLTFVLLALAQLVLGACSRQSRLDAALAGLGKAESDAEILRIVGSCDDPVETEALKRRAIAALLPRLGSFDNNRRCAAARMLGEIGGAGAVAALTAKLSDKVFEALARIRDVRAVEPMIAKLQDENWEVRACAVTALGKIGDRRAVEPVIARLKDEYLDVRVCAFDALGRLGDPRAVPPLVGFLRNEDDRIRQWATEALGKIGDHQATEPLIALLADRNLYLLRKVLAALGQIGDERAVRPLRAKLADPDWDVRAGASAALRMIGTPAREILRASHGANSQQPFGIKVALANLGDQEATTEVLGKLASGAIADNEVATILSYCTSPGLLEQIENTSRDPGLRIAARVARVGEAEWDKALGAAAGDPDLIDATASAIAYSGSKLSRIPSIESLCVRCIQRGNSRTISRLMRLIETHGSQALANYYLNCGEPMLKHAATAWCQANGLVVETKLGSTGIVWGQEKP